MLITVAGFKGGVAKTTTAIHLACYLSQRGSTLLIDADPNRSALSWSQRGEGLPFLVLDEEAAVGKIATHRHTVIDTQARPSPDELEDLSTHCDLLVLPCTPDALALDALLLTVEALKPWGSGRYRVLLSIVPPWPSGDGAEARTFLKQAGIPTFRGMVRRFSVYQKAALLGLPVYAVPDPKAKVAWSDYLSIGQELGL
ncbi:MAG: ParA family protein [Cyanobacteriota bacterium]|nr:ParA family protein [Cyanobacteriota bacterium]